VTDPSEKSVHIETHEAIPIIPSLLLMKLLPFCGYGQRNYEASAWDFVGVKKRERRKETRLDQYPVFFLILLAVREGRAHSSWLRDKHSFTPVRRPCF
jgi:hypothetical protein